MDLTSPIRSVVPSAHGEVLSVLARSGQPLTGRSVAALTGGRLSVKGVNLALRRLATAGIVLVEDHPPAKLYRLNRRHLAADAIAALAELRPQLIEAMRAALERWDRPAAGAWLFGSAARGDGGVESDIDVLLVRSDDSDTEDPQWTAQVELFAEDVLAWSGNPCAIVEYSDAEFARLMAGDERLARDLRNEGIGLTPRRLPPRRPGAAP